MIDSNKKQTILAVDDTPANIDVVRGILSDSYLVKAATSGQKALKIIDKEAPDLILLDVMMPEMDGYDVCKLIKSNKTIKDIPIIFLTALSEDEDEAKGLALGAVDYITKPIRPSILKERVKNHLELKQFRDALKEENQVLENMVNERTQQLDELQDVTMVAMGALAESRDPETGNHIRRTQNYVKLLALELRKYERFESYLTPKIVTSLFKSAPLHDIGKVGVPDHILLKPGKLTEEEFEEMKKHTVYGRDAIASAEKSIVKAHDFLILAKEIAYSHQEKWDGTGYPLGLAGDTIPISARIMAVADVYDALISKRIYKPAFTHEKALKIIKEGKGSHFDPDVVDAFINISDEFRKVASMFADE